TPPRPSPSTATQSRRPRASRARPGSRGVPGTTPSWFRSTTSRLSGATKGRRGPLDRGAPFVLCRFSSCVPGSRSVDEVDLHLVRDETRLVALVQEELDRAPAVRTVGEGALVHVHADALVDRKRTRLHSRHVAT